MPQAKNTYNKGLNRDTHPLKMSNSQYTNMRNFKLLTDSGGSIGAIVNERGTKLDLCMPTVQATYVVNWEIAAGTTVTINGVNITFTGTTADEVYNELILTYATDIADNNFVVSLNTDEIRIIGVQSLTVIDNNDPVIIAEETPLLENVYIIGMTSLNDRLVIFTTGTTESEPSTGDGQIWYVEYDESTNIIKGLDSDGCLVPETHLKFSGCMNLSTEHAITRAIARYETSTIARVYWTDNYNSLRSFNLNDADGIGISCSNLDIRPNIKLSQPVITDISNGGAIPAGSSIQVAYRLIGGNKQTNVSPATPLFPLYQEDDESDLYKEIKGSSEGDVETKSITFTIDDIDINFDTIEYIFVLYEETDVPVIYSFSESIPASGSVTQTFTNNESDLILLSDAEYNEIITDFKTAKDIAIKDNRLIAVNLKLTEFEIKDEEFDARAYRFNSSGNSTVYQSNGTSSTIPADYTLEYSHDAINPYNNPNHPNFERFEFQSDGTTLGGEGAFIKYSFITEDILGDERGQAGGLPWAGILNRTTTDLQLNANGVTQPITNQFYNYTSPFIKASLTGYQRDEVYRFGIVFYSKKGETSFVKWIGDIKMPDSCQSQICNNGNTTDTSPMNLKALGVQFDVTIPDSMKSKIDAYEIVRLERKLDDMSRMGGGVHLALRENSDVIQNNPLIWSQETNESEDGVTGFFPNAYVRYVSPLQLFRDVNGYTFKDGDYLQANYGYTKDSGTPGSAFDDHNVSGTDSDGNSGGDAELLWWKLFKPDCYATTDNNVLPVAPIKAHQYVPNGGTLDLQDVDPGTSYSIYENERWQDSDIDGGECSFMRMDINMNNVIQNFSDQGFSRRQLTYFTYCRNLAKQYGGNTYESRSSNQYIPTSAVVFTNLSDNVKVFGGDTYVTYFMYEHDNHVDAANFEDKVSRAVAFPCETIVNTDLRHGNFFKKNRGPSGGSLYTSYGEEQFACNKVYHQSNNLTSKLQAKNFIAQTSLEFPYTIWASENKINGELVDSWATFLTANKIDVEGIYGPINSAHNFKDKLFFYQDKAFGIAPVNERAVFTDENGTDLQIGSGDVLSEYAYISTHTGAFHRTAVVPAENNIYHFDSRQKKIWRYTLNSKVPLSDIKGLSSWADESFKHTPLEDTDNPTGFEFPVNIHGAYEHRYNRVFFTFMYRRKDEDRINETIAYNELVDGFESFYDFFPKMYLSTGRKMLSISPNNDNTLHQHDEGTSYCSYYGNDPVSSVLEIIVNGGNDLNKGWGNIEWLSNMTAGSNDIQSTFETIKINNDYQDTGEVTLVPFDNVRRRFRTWRHAVGRDNETSGATAKIRNPWIRIEFTQPNTNGYRFISNDITTHFLLDPINDYKV